MLGGHASGPGDGIAVVTLLHGSPWHATLWLRPRQAVWQPRGNTATPLDFSSICPLRSFMVWLASPRIRARVEREENQESMEEKEYREKMAVHRQRKEAKLGKREGVNMVCVCG